jgi:hypothetical protein
VKADAAPVRVIHRLSQQVIEIDEHRGDHDQRRASPTSAKAEPCDGDRNGKVKQ